MAIIKELKERIINQARSLFGFAKYYKKTTAILFIIASIFIWRIVSSQVSPVDNLDAKPRVSLTTIGEVTNASRGIITTGEVESASQAEIKSEVSGKIQNIYVTLGNFVSAGQQLVVLNGDELYASLLQAQASLQAAREQLSTTGTSLDSAMDNLHQVRVENSIDKIRTAVDVAVNAMVTYSDIQSRYFSNNSGSSVQVALSKEKALVLIYNKSQLGRTEPWYFLGLETGLISELKKAEKADQNFNYEKLIEDTRTALTEVQSANQLIYGRLLGESSATQTDINSIASNIDLIIAQISSLTSQKQAIASAENNLERVRASLDLSENSITESNQSVIKQAEASLALAAARFNKTIIRSPISGYVSYIDPEVRTGNLINPGQLIASVVSKSNYKVRAFIDNKDVVLVSVGNEVIINDDISGVVSIISPGLNPINKKVEIIITVTGQNTNLINGEFVNISILPDLGSQNLEGIFLPLETVKITRESSFIMTLDENGSTINFPVSIGRIVGDSIEITSDIPSDMRFIISVRGLGVGEEVEVIE